MNDLERTVSRRFLLAALLIVMLAACSADEDRDGEEMDTPDATPVRVVAVETASVDEVERAVGTVETFSQPVVAAEVSGRISEVVHDVGDRVEAGDVLARIESEPFEIARAVAAAEVGRLEARVRQLESDFRRLERLSEREYATEQDLDSLGAELDGAREQLSSARSQRRKAERDLGLTDIKAPVDGIVDERMLSEGGFVAAGNPAFRIQPLDRFRAILSFPEQVGDRLQTGMTVRLTATASRNSEVAGELARLRPAVHPGSRAVRAVVEFDNPGNWRPGMTVEARVILEQRENALRVPVISLVQRPAGRVVYVLDGDEVRERRVETGVRTPQWVEIRAGLDGDERVVTEGAPFLTDGARVRVREEG